MVTKATLEKLKDLVGANDLSLSEIKFVLKHWEDAPTRLHGNVLKSAGALDKIPPAVQVDLVSLSDKALRTLGDRICPDAQDAIVKDFKEDIPALVKIAPKLTVISEGLWRVLASVASGKSKNLLMSTATANRLVQRKGCPPAFAKAIGLTRELFEKAQRKGQVKTRQPQTVKQAEPDEEFTDTRRVAKAVRTAKRVTR